MIGRTGHYPPQTSKFSTQFHSQDFHFYNRFSRHVSLSPSLIVIFTGVVIYINIAIKCRKKHVTSRPTGRSHRTPELGKSGDSSRLVVLYTFIRWRKLAKHVSKCCCSTMRGLLPSKCSDPTPTLPQCACPTGDQGRLLNVL